MCNKNSSTIKNDAQIRLLARQTSQGYVTAVQWTEYQQTLVKAVDADQSHQQWLQAHGLNDVNPSEVFAS